MRPGGGDPDPGAELFQGAQQRPAAEAYNQSRRDLFATEGSGKVLILEPESTAGFSRTERDVEKIRALWQSGYSVGHRALDDVRAFWTEE